MRQRAARLGMLMALLVVLGVTPLGLGSGQRAVQAQGGAAVSIVDFAFQPASVEVAAGSTVTWTNTGQAPHTVTADDGAFDSGQLAPGASFSQTFDTAGTFTYHCNIHPQMTGTIIVTGGGGGQAAAPAQGGNQAAGNQGGDQGGKQGGGKKANQVPAVGVGTMALASHTRDLTVALLVGLMALALGLAAVRTARRA
jgi:plastocyanin